MCVVRFELTTYRLKGGCSATELYAHYTVGIVAKWICTTTSVFTARHSTITELLATEKKLISYSYLLPLARPLWHRLAPYRVFVSVLGFSPLL